MKKLIALLFCNILAVNIFALNSYYLENSENNDKSIKNAALFIRPFEMYDNYKNSLYGICLESQSAFNSFWGLRVNTDYLVNSNTFDVDLTIGPQISIMNNGLEGLLIGLYPGTKFVSNDESFNFQTKIYAECTYNYKLNGDWGLGVYVGSDLVKLNNIEFGIKIGRYMSNSYYRN